MPGRRAAAQPGVVAGVGPTRPARLEGASGSMAVGSAFMLLTLFDSERLSLSARERVRCSALVTQVGFTRRRSTCRNPRNTTCSFWAAGRPGSSWPGRWPHKGDAPRSSSGGMSAGRAPTSPACRARTSSTAPRSPTISAAAPSSGSPTATGRSTWPPSATARGGWSMDWSKCTWRSTGKAVLSSSWARGDSSRRRRSRSR